MPTGVLKKLVSQQTPGRPPFIPLIYSYAARLIQAPVRKILTNPTLLTKSISTVHELFHTDVLAFPFDDTLEAEALGAAVSFRPEAAARIERPSFSTLDLPPEPLETLLQRGRLPVIFETLKRLKEQLGKEIDLLAGVTGPLTLAFQLRGEGFKEDFLSKQREALPFIEFTAQVVTRIIRNYGELGVSGILLSESAFSLAGGEMLSLLNSISTPIFNTCNYFEIPVIFYPDGITAEAGDVLTDLPWSGFIINNPGEQEQLIKELSAKGRCIGMPLASGLLMNQPGQQLSKVLEALLLMGNCGSFFVTTEGDLSHQIPVESLHAVRNYLKR